MDHRVGHKPDVVFAAGRFSAVTLGRVTLRQRDGGSAQRLGPAAIPLRESTAPGRRGWGGLQPATEARLTGKLSAL